MGAQGKLNLPLASRDQAWDSAKAVGRVKSWAGGPGKDSIDFSQYAKAFLWKDNDNPEAFGSYKLPYADVINGTLTAIPRAIFAAAGAIQGARGGVKIPGPDLVKVRDALSKWYSVMRKEFEDDTLKAPWETSNQRARGELKIHLEIGSVRTEMLEGRSHLVVPAVMIRVGVLNGALHVPEELAKSVEGWNGRPVTLAHPQIAGQDVSANSPAVLTFTRVGYIFNTEFDGDQLRCEFWLDERKCEGLGEDGDLLLANIRSGIPIDVSTGYFSEDEESSGTFQGDAYNLIRHNLIPDHCAILLHGVGACSWADGCGVPRVNEETMDKKSAIQDPETEKKDTMKALGFLRKFLATLGAEGLLGEKPKQDPKSLRIVRCLHCGEAHESVEAIPKGAFLVVNCPKSEAPIVLEPESSADGLKINGTRLSKILRAVIQERSEEGAPSESDLIQILASATGESPDYITRLTAGEVDFPSRHVLSVLSAVLGLEPWFFFEAFEADATNTIRSNADEKPNDPDCGCNQGESTMNGPKKNEETTNTPESVAERLVASGHFDEEKKPELVGLGLEILGKIEASLKANSDTSEEPKPEPEKKPETNEETPNPVDQFASRFGFTSEEAGRVLANHVAKTRKRREQALSTLEEKAKLEPKELEGLSLEVLESLASSYPGESNFMPLGAPVRSESKGAPEPPKIFEVKNNEEKAS